MKISIIIPCYNEEKTILTILKKIQNVKMENMVFEVIVIDDGSQDKTRELLENNRSLYNIYLPLTKNGGKGAAVKAGLQAASGDYILFQDADLEYDPKEFPTLFFPIKEFGAHIVIGSRFLSPKYTTVGYFWHKVGNFLITFLFNVFNNTTFTDIYSCYLVYKRDLVDPSKLVTSGWQQQAEILSKAVKKGRLFYEVPISYHGRTYGEGKKIRGHHALSVFWAIFRFKFFS